MKKTLRVVWLPYEDAAAYAQEAAKKHGINSRRKWAAWANGKLPNLPNFSKYIPTNPNQTYFHKGWDGWDSFFGKENVQLKNNLAQSASKWRLALRIDVSSLTAAEICKVHGVSYVTAWRGVKNGYICKGYHDGYETTQKGIKKRMARKVASRLLPYKVQVYEALESGIKTISELTAKTGVSLRTLRQYISGTNKLLEGNKFYSISGNEIVLREKRNADLKEKKGELTRQVKALFAEGFSDNEIAEELNMSKSSVTGTRSYLKLRRTISTISLVDVMLPILQQDENLSLNNLCELFSTYTKNTIYASVYLCSKKDKKFSYFIQKGMVVKKAKL
jgi:predicted transcriptional regulator